MRIEVIRKEFTKKSTIGDMVIDGEYFCYTLEDVVRVGDKIPGQTAIPYGKYEVITDHSARFKKLMPLIKNVPGFSGVRIHSGNTDHDTEGCILVGFTKSKDFIGQSRDAFVLFMEKLKTGLNEGKVTIEIRKEG